MRPGSGAVVITGASGLIGRHLRPELSDRPVTLLGRRRLDLQPNETWQHTDLAQPVTLPHLPSSSSLCHMAYAMDEHEANLAYTHHAIDAVNACPTIDHVVMMSSVSVYGANAAGLIDEETTPRPDSAYARTKAACEKAWLDRLRRSCRLTVLRPTAVIASDGPGLDALVGDALHHPARSIAKRALQHRSTVHFIAVDTVVAATRFVLDREGQRREIFVVSDDEAPENSDYATMQQTVRGLVGRKPLGTPVLPQPLERPLGRILGKPLGVRRMFSSAKIAEAGFVPRASLLDIMVENTKT